MTPLAALAFLFVAAPARPVPAPAPVPAAPVPECAQPSSSSSKTVRVMLPDVTTGPRQQHQKDALTQLVAAEAARVSGYSVLSAAEVRAVLDKEASAQLVGCSATECLAELASALDAELIISGSVGESDDGAALVTLSLVNAHAIVVVNRVSATWRGPDHRLSDVVKTSAQLLLLAPKERPPGSIVLSNFDASARVLVDGIDRTADARGGGRIDGVDVGVHEVTLEGPDKITLVTPVVVMSGAEATVDATLEPVPVPGALLVAGGVSAVVVGAAATAAVLYFIGRGDVNVSAAVPVASINNVEALRGIGK